jgi:cysteine synthase A
MLYNNIYETIGNTPMIKINTVNNNTIYLKLEWFNPGGSVKDRIAINMIEQAEKQGFLTKGDTIIEPTSGNTGIGLAMVAAAKGYDIILTMPDSLSIERRKILVGYGAKLILTPAKKGMNGSIDVASKLQKENNYFMPMQFENINNPKAHMNATYYEIIEDCPTLNYFVAGVGTGGTLTGVGTMLKKEYNKKIKLIAVEPKNSPVISGGTAGPHKIQGIGAGFIPKILNTSIIDEVYLIDNDEAYETVRLLAKEYGLFVGISSGANMAAALKLAETVTNQHIVTISPDNAERYLSTDLFNQLEGNKQ